MEPLAPAAPVSKARAWLQATAAVVWARRWKLLGVAGVYLLGRACEFVSEPFQSACEMLAKLAKALP